MQKTLKIWLPTIFWATIIFFVSSLPSVKVTPIGLLQHWINIFGHLFEYAVLAALLYRSLKKQGFPQTLSTNLTLIIPTLYALTDEFHQSFVPGRQSDPLDLAIDIFGIIIATQLLIKKERKS